MRIKEIRYIPIPYAKALLEKAIEGRESYEQINSTMIEKTLDYLRQFSKCGPEESMKLVEKLRDEFHLSEMVAVMVVNILPKTVFELRAILSHARAGGTLTDEELQKIIEVLREHCGGE